MSFAAGSLGEFLISFSLLIAIPCGMDMAWEYICSKFRDYEQRKTFNDLIKGEETK